MKLNLIVAVASNGVIGGDNKLLWHLPADLKYFKQLTTNNTIIMGRKTYDSIGRPLPNRTNIVISRNKNITINGCYTVTSLENAIKKAQELFVSNEANQEQQIFVIGGAQIYKLALETADKIYLTEIKANFEGDTFFEKIDESLWIEIARESHTADKKNTVNFDFATYEKKIIQPQNKSF
jgi:dihydrofolate reductase